VLKLGAAPLGAQVRRVLFVGAHSDDIEIGCGGTVLQLLDACPDLEVDWVVLTAPAERADEASASAGRFLAGAGVSRVRIESFRERYFPYQPELKEWFDALGREIDPDLVLCPWGGDAHQDHRTVSELVGNTFRDQLVLEYEIPKFDGDLGRPSVYVHLEERHAEAKLEGIIEGFPSQKRREWFTEETFRALLRLRGIESRAPSGLAEAFHCRKMVLL
jgi:LmbE family N-acetylglucosaminyl deacetylase